MSTSCYIDKDINDDSNIINLGLCLENNPYDTSTCLNNYRNNLDSIYTQDKIDRIQECIFLNNTKVPTLPPEENTTLKPDEESKINAWNIFWSIFVTITVITILYFLKKYYYKNSKDGYKLIYTIENIKGRVYMQKLNKNYLGLILQVIIGFIEIILKSADILLYKISALVYLIVQSLIQKLPKRNVNTGFTLVEEEYDGDDDVAGDDL